MTTAKTAFSVVRPNAAQRRLTPPGFFGRESDIAAIEAHFDSGEPVVVITGFGGVGKTTLAERVVALHRARNLTAIVCALSECRSAKEMCEQIWRALSRASPPRDDPGNDRIDEIGHEIARREGVLIVLDNMEHLASEGGRALERWCDLAPRARFLVTSRARISIRTSIHHELRPLSLPGEPGVSIADSHAVQLMVDRICRSRNDYVLTRTEEPLIADIVCQLDGAPLAIELAASRIAVFGAAALRDKLRQRFSVLAAKDGVERHRTLRNAIDWSWHLLAPHEQRALIQSSVFRGGFGLDAAERVIDLSDQPAAPAVMDTLQALCEHSLIHPLDSKDHLGSTRLGMYLSIREYAEQQVADDAALNALHTRHLTYYASTAAKCIAGVDGTDAAQSLDALEVERHNLTSAVEWQLSKRNVAGADFGHVLVIADALGRLAESRGSVSSALVVLEQVLSRRETSGCDAALLAQCLIDRNNLGRRAAGSVSSPGDAEHAVALARTAGDPNIESRALRSQAWDQINSGQCERAAEIFRLAAERAQAGGDAVGEGRSLVHESVALHVVGRDDEARRGLVRALELFRKHGVDQDVARAVHDLGILDMEVGAHESAKQRFAEALEIQSRWGDDSLVYQSLQVCMATLDHDMGHVAEAIATYEQAFATMDRLGDQLFGAFYGGYLGIAYMEQGQLALARKLFESATRGDSHAGRRQLFGAFLAGLDAMTGRPDDAEGGFGAVERTCDPSDEATATVIRVLRTHVDCCHAREAARAGDAARALELRRTAEVAARSSWRERSIDVRLAERTVRAHLEIIAKEVEPLTLDAAGGWFAVPRKPRTDISHRESLRLLLRALIVQHLSQPGKSLSGTQCAAAGWPNERGHDDSLRARLHTAVATLRNLGLRDYLVADATGYRLDHTRVFEIVRES